MDTVDAVARALFHCDTGSPVPFEDLAQLAQDRYRALARAAIDALGLTEEHQWVPVQSDGHRWEPRSEGLANAAYALYRRGGHAHNAALDHPVDHIEHESRLVSGWVRKDNTNE